MPVNFTKGSIYTIDYSILSDHFLNLPIFEDESIQEYYIENWIKLLRDHDKVLTEQFDSPDKLTEYTNNVIKHNEKEVFQQPLTLSNLEIFIHFRVSALIKILHAQNIDLESAASNISLTDFTKADSDILWTPVKVDPNHDIKNQPIFIVPLLNGKQRYLVIDGNHRISTAVQAKKDIKGLSLAEVSVIDYEIFSSGFDKLFYIFFNEINHIANKKHRENISDIDLAKMSYLTDGVFKF